MAHVRILYAIESQAFATKIERVLQETGQKVSRTEVNQESATSLGDIDSAPEAMIVIWSRQSIASQTVIAEARKGLADRILTPVTIGKIEPPQSFVHLWPIDLSGWTGAVEDPRWRFVTDEINLSIRRGGVDLGAEETFSFSTPYADKNQEIQKTSIPNRAVIFGGAIGIAITAILLVALTPVFFGDTPEPPSLNVALAQTPASGQSPATVSEPSPSQTIGNTNQLADEIDPDASTEPDTPPQKNDSSQDGSGNLYSVNPVRPDDTSGLPTTAQVPAARQTNQEISADKTASLSQQPIAPIETPPASNEAEAPTVATLTEETGSDDGNPDGARPEFKNTPPAIRDNATPAAVKPVVTAALNSELSASTETAETIAETTAGATAGATTEAAAATEVASDVLSKTPSIKPPAADQPQPDPSSSAPVKVAAAENTAATKDADGLDRLIVENTVLASNENANLGAYFRECLNCPDMAELPGGGFYMGTPENERARHVNENAFQKITIPYRFALSKNEITFDQWDACVADGGCRGYQATDPGWGRGSRPVVNVSWEDAQSYIDWLARKTGQDYRLPTEAEWEYAARSGASTPFSFGSAVTTQNANYNGSYRYGGPAGVNRAQTTPVGSFSANQFGLFDMHGNVWEWTSDCWSVDEQSSDADCEQRVLKGGAWNTGGWRLRAGHRIAGVQDRRDYDNGFRVARTLVE